MSPSLILLISIQLLTKWTTRLANGSFLDSLFHKNFSMKLIHLYNLKPTFKSYSDLFQLLSRRRKIQIFYLFLLSIFSAVSEAANIGLLIPFLDILGDAENNIYKLGIFGSVLKNLPPNLLLLSLAFFFILLTFYFFRKR